jgi:S-ribosylhomocysteine lyase LuxS involved in autoinducer biosynthesis
MILNNIAVQIESTLNPPTILEHKSIIAAFINNKNNPSVKIVTGSVRRTKTGFIKILSNPKTIATISDVIKLSIYTPFIKREISITNIAVRKILKISFISLN